MKKKGITERPSIAIVGAGAVGAATAYTLILCKVAAQIIIYDINVDKCCGIGESGVGIWLKYTPLQLAVSNGHIEVTRILLTAGADKNKKIESEAYANEDAKNARSLTHIAENIKSTIEKLQKEQNVGLSTIELAKMHVEHPKEFDYVSPVQRKAILDLLQKKDQ